MSDQVPDLSKALEARRLERVVQAKARLQVVEGKCTVDFVIHMAAKGKYGRYLLGIPLRQLFLDQPGWGEKRTEAALRKIAEFSGSRLPKRPNIAWLLDPRCAGSRYIAFCDVMHMDRSTPPWAGFPFTASPTEVTTYPDVQSLRKAASG